MQHAEDKCEVSTLSLVKNYINKIEDSVDVNLVVISGGEPPKTHYCYGLSAHGFYGVEDDLVRAITDWIASLK